MRTRIRERNRARRGVTLVEVLIVVAIMALVASAVAVAALHYYEDARRKTARTDALTIRQAVRGWWALHESSECPTIAQLTSAGVLDEASPIADPWGTQWSIECSGTSVTVTSSGADRRPGTPDDIRVPPRSS